MISSTISRGSAAVLLIIGVALLFAADMVLPKIIPGFPPGSAWFGQLLGTSWIGFAALNWQVRTQVLGGIYGRPIVFANVCLFFPSALVLVEAHLSAGAPSLLWIVTVPCCVLAAAHVALMLKGPFDKLQP